ncbi:MAG TPA: sodium:solute symporter [Saprospiraceae bacterium]|nr:sodium:solute symporter [Saprospiraceae bacterium]
MTLIDWIVMLGTIFGIVAYGIYKTRNVNTAQSYLKGDRDLKWWTIGLSIMATQASAITFLSTPGQAYNDGMGFAQFYFGLPIAMVVLAVFVLPIYYRLNVYTAYEYLENRFDLKMRVLTSFLFLIQRGLAAGITIYAPAIILSTILGWPLRLTILAIGSIVIFYTVMGGTKAVSVTQKQQMIVILLGMILAAVLMVYRLPPEVSLNDALHVAGKMGKLEVVNFEFDIKERYNIWTGIFGSVFLFLSYFGTDQSQVQRYLSGRSLTESRLGLLFNGLLKVPMQFLILFVGVLVFLFYQFNQPPVHFNNANADLLAESQYSSEYETYQEEHTAIFDAKQTQIRSLLSAMERDDEAAIQESREVLADLSEQDKQVRESVKELILQNNPAAKVEDKDYVFITYILNYLPIGIVGLLIAVIFSAAMSSTASELSALATTSLVDIYRRLINKDGTDRHYLLASKGLTILWGGLALLFAIKADLFDNLIQAVNYIGSLFYGAILGVFAVAFLLKKVKGNAVFIGTILGEAVVLIFVFLERYDYIELAYLWLNPIGCLAVMGFSLLAQGFMGDRSEA